jgi:hypothetical protein
MASMPMPSGVDWLAAHGDELVARVHEIQER